jgi:hypothetical protein
VAVGVVVVTAVVAVVIVANVVGVAEVVGDRLVGVDVSSAVEHALASKTVATVAAMKNRAFMMLPRCS